jgi:ATP-binding cassette subfamily B protein
MYRADVGAFVTSSALTSACAIVPALVFRAILDEALPAADYAQLVMLSLLGGAAAVGAFALTMVQAWTSARVGEGVVFQLRVAAYDKLQRMPLSFFTATKTGAITSRLSNDVVAAQFAISGVLGSVVSNVVLLAFTASAMAFLDWRLMILVLGIFPLLLIPAKRVGRHLERIAVRRMELYGAMNARMTERLDVSGALLVKLFANYDDEAESFAREAGAVRDLGVAQVIYGRVFVSTVTLLGGLGTAIIYGVGGAAVISGRLSAGTLVAFAALTIQSYGPISTLSGARADVMSSVASVARVVEVLDMAVPIADAPNAVVLRHPRGKLQFDNVSFSYPAGVASAALSIAEAGHKRDNGAEVLTDISITVRPGEKLALVGPSGSGKSTLAALLLRLYDVTRGAIRIDDVDVRDLTWASLQAAIGVVNQDPHVFHQTLEESLRLAKPSATDSELEHVCTVARLTQTIERLPDGFATVVGERGYRLSGGEKQRLAIARALLKNPAVFVLDEATSSLDVENERLVKEALDSAFFGRTALIIAHRLSTIRDADNVAVLEQGRVVRFGPPSDVLGIAKGTGTGVAAV